MNNEIGNGHIILLHDAGGNREATVAALPRIIDRYLAQGYHFGLVSDLVGKTRAEVMPVPSTQELRLARIEGGAFDFEARFFQGLGLLLPGGDLPHGRAVPNFFGPGDFAETPRKPRALRRFVPSAGHGTRRRL